MMIIKGSLRKYVGAIICEEDAARLYDKFAFFFWGRLARVNFSYSKAEILELLKEEETAKPQKRASSE